MAETAKKLPKSRAKWVLLCCGVILIAACAVGAAVWFTRPPTLEEMTSHMPESPSEAWMQRYVDLAVEDSEFQAYIFDYSNEDENSEAMWWEKFEKQPLVDEVGGGQYFTVKWLWAVPRQYEGFTSEVPFWQIRETEEYGAYYAKRFQDDPVCHRIVAGNVDDPDEWWKNFAQYPVVIPEEERSYFSFEWDQAYIAFRIVGIVVSFPYPYEELQGSSYGPTSFPDLGPPDTE